MPRKNKTQYFIHMTMEKQNKTKPDSWPHNSVGYHHDLIQVLDVEGEIRRLSLSHSSRRNFKSADDLGGDLLL